MAVESTASPTGGDAPLDQLTVTLQVVSPSVGVAGPLRFPDIPATTTMKQLKEKIRQELPLRPADDQQRLIYRGRAFSRDTDTLVDMLGEAAIRSNEQQTIHLVIREVTTDAPPPPTTDVRGRNPAPVGQPASQHPLPPQVIAPQTAPGFPRRTPIQPATMGPPPPGTVPSPGPNVNQPADPATLFQQHHQNMSSWLSQLHRDGRARAMVRENQRTRAMMGMRGIGDHNNNHPTEPTSGRASPAPIGHYYREALGPNGQTYQVETVIRSSTPAQPGAPHGGLTPAEVQNLLRTADMSQATNTMATAMHRSASGASLHSLHNTRPLGQPGTTTSVHPRSSSRPAPSGRATPDIGVPSFSGGSAATAGNPTSQPQQTQGVEVYILSSPEGPRALLVNNGTSETYYSPRMPTPLGYPRLRNMITPIATAPGTPPLPPQAGVPGTPFGEQQPPPPPEHVRQVNEAAQPPLPDGINDPDNLQEPGIPPLLVQAWPHLWLLFRLALFVYFFTSPQASWGRWLSVIGLAIFIFIISVGALHGIADLARRPIAQQLQNAVPGLNPQQQYPGANQNPDPADMAARLVAQRQQENWLQSQLRRIERAGLLFLASIAPGVAERHIANLEAEARAERQRREAEAAEAARRQREEEEASSNAAGGEADEAQPPTDGAREHHDAAPANPVAT